MVTKTNYYGWISFEYQRHAVVGYRTYIYRTKNQQDYPIFAIFLQADNTWACKVYSPRLERYVDFELRSISLNETLKSLKFSDLNRAKMFFTALIQEYGDYYVSRL